MDNLSALNVSPLIIYLSIAYWYVCACACVLDACLIESIWFAKPNEFKLRLRSAIPFTLGRFVVVWQNGDKKLTFKSLCLIKWMEFNGVYLVDIGLYYVSVEVILALHVEPIMPRNEG